MNELKETNKKNVNAYEDLNNKFKRLNELYDSCENEKLAVQADYETLKEQYNELKINADAYEEAAREYESISEEYEAFKASVQAKQLSEKELYKFKKDDINNLCDTILDFFKDKNLNDK